MLVWINGPFGGGKTHVAAELHHRLPDSWVSDPEHVGFGLHAMMPPAVRGDFQDLPSWRQGAFEALDVILDQYDGTVIVPMTIVDSTYFDSIVGRLRDAGHDVRHFTLLAQPATVRKRLHDRGFGRAYALLGRDPLAREAFAVERVEGHLNLLGRPEFAEHIWTDDLAVSQVAERIALACGLTLRSCSKSRSQVMLRRTVTTLRHLRSI